MKNRPRLDIPKTAAEKFANIIGYSVFIGGLIYAIINFPSFPAEIPMQFGVDGEVNRYGSPYEMIILLVLPFILIPGLEALERFPQVHNYPLRMDESNMEAFYLNSRTIANFAKNACLIIFAIVFIEITNYALTGTSTFGPLLLPLILILALGPVFWGLWQRWKIK